MTKCLILFYLVGLLVLELAVKLTESLPFKNAIDLSTFINDNEQFGVFLFLSLKT